MLSDLLFSRLIQGGLVFFLLVVGGSLLYSWHIQHTTEAEFEKRPLAVESLQNTPATNTAPVDFQTEGVPNTPDANTDTPMSETTEALSNEDDDFADAFLPEDFVSEETPAAEVPVSPFGFGPYPEVPAGVSYIMFPAPSANVELMMRVRLKLISQGINATGATMEDGLVYPVIKGIGYVQWESYWRPTGKVTYISRFKGHPKDGARLDAIRFEKGKSLTRADVPSDIKLISFEEGAIDPYQFLDLRTSYTLNNAVKPNFIPLHLKKADRKCVMLLRLHSMW